MDNKTELMHYLQDAVNILKLSLDLARQDSPAFYRVIALQMRLLLCDTTRQHGRLVDISLAPRLLPGLALPPLLPGGLPDKSALALPLSSWLQQKIAYHASTPQTVRQLIRQVCDLDGGAHVDPKPHANLPPQPERQRWIILLGSLVADELTPVIQGYNRAGQGE